ncbi:MAG: phenylalanine--tRNA ligase subunit alpha, partial [Microcystis sp.]
MSLSPHPIETALKTLTGKAENSIEETTTLEDLEQLRVNYLGKKGELSQILREMGKLSPEERPRLGAIANEVKELVQSLLESRRESLNNAQIQAKLAAETLDVTLPALSRPLGRIHPLNSTVDRMIDIFVGLGYSIATGPQVESDYYNFEALNIPADHPARDMQDTFFLRDGRLLRT